MSNVTIGQQPLQVRALTREFRLFTQGQEPGIDGLAIICEVLKGLAENERSAALFWVADYYGFTLAPKRS